LNAGQHNLSINIPEDRLSNGAYFLRVIDMDGYVQTERLIRNNE